MGKVQEVCQRNARKKQPKKNSKCFEPARERTSGFTSEEDSQEF